MKDKRILLIASFPESLPNFRGDLIQAFIKAGFHIHCAAPNLSSQITVTNKLNNWNCTCHDLPFKRSGINPIFDLMALIFLIYLIFRYRFQIVLGYTIKPIIYGAVASWLLRVPIRVALVTGLGFSFTSQDGLGFNLTQRVAQHLYRIAMFCATKVFFQNNDDSALFVDNHWVSPAKIELIAGSGVNTACFPFIPITQKSPTHFLMIARFLRDKGLLEYVEAARIVKRKYPSVLFSLAGWLDDNPAAVSQEDLDKWVSDRTINLLGKLEDVIPAIAACSVYVLPSYREGMPRTVLEAMAIGRPIVTTDAPGCRDTVIEGENGFLVPIKSPKALAGVMIRFIEHPECLEAMGRNSRRLVEQKFDVSSVNDKILKTLGLAVQTSHNLPSQLLDSPREKFFTKKFKISIIVSSPMTIHTYLLNHIKILSRNFDVTVAANFMDQNQERVPDVTNYKVRIRRKINVLSDASALFSLYLFFRRNSFYSTLSVTPKAGFLTCLAAYFARVPVRLHYFTGQIWVTRKGIKRSFLKFLDWVLGALSTEVLIDGYPQREFLLSQRIISSKKGVVLSHGSLSGVDFDRFKVDSDLRYSVRDELGIPRDDFVILFLGRINRDKGILDLANAFNAMAKKEKNIWFLCVGPDEENLVPIVKRICDSSIHRTFFFGHTKRPESMMNASDIFCLPSYREGFPTVIQEAAACGIPSVATKIYGLEGSILDGETGLLFEPGNVKDMHDALLKLCKNESLRAKMAAAAMSRTLEMFSRDDITGELVKFYSRYVPVRGATYYETENCSNAA